MAITPTTLLVLAAAAHSALAAAVAVPQAGNTGGGWYVVDETLTCTNTCSQLQNCVITSAPTDDDINAFCREISDDCADGQLSDGSRAYTYLAGAGILGTAGFGSSPADGNNGCPNNDDCYQSFKYLAGNMRYPSAPGHPDPECFQAFIEVNGYYNHQKTGRILVTLPTLKVVPPREKREGM